MKERIESVPDAVRQSILAKVLLAVVFVILLSGAINGVFYTNISADLDSQVDQQVSATTTLHENAYSNWLDNRYAELSDAGERVLSGEGTTEQLVVEETRSDQIREYHLVDSDSGEVLTSSNDDAVGENVLDWGFDSALLDRGQFIYPGQYTAVDGAEAIAIGESVPLEDQILVAEMEARFAGPALDHPIEDSTTSLVSQNGEVILGEPVDGELSTDIRDETLVSQHDGTIRGTTRLSTDNELLVVTQTPSEQAFALRDDVLWSFAVTTLVTFLILGVVTVVGGRSMIRDIEALDDKAQQMRAGDLHVDFSTDRVDAIGRLAESFGQTQTELRDQIEQSALIENASILVTVLDNAGTISYQSPSARSLLGYDPEALKGTPFTDQIHPDDRAAVEDALDSISSIHHDETRIEFRIEDADGEVHVLEGIAENLNETPFVEGIVISSRDITERKAREQELRRQNNRLDQFASVVSHDLRNPLGIAEMYLDFARDSGNEDDFEAVAEAHDRMNEMIDDLLALARVETTIQDPEKIVLRELAADAWETAQTEGATFDNDLDSLTVQGDPSLLQNLFENLFRNAVDHNDEPVTIRTGELNDTGFFIEDDGVGIPADKREEVFDHGFTTDEDGTGFGLAIVSELVEAHGWEITVTESASGGARFEIRHK